MQIRQRDFPRYSQCHQDARTLGRTTPMQRRKLDVVFRRRLAAPDSFIQLAQPRASGVAPTHQRPTIGGFCRFCI